jgi:hypothetical protein
MWRTFLDNKIKKLVGRRPVIRLHLWWHYIILKIITFYTENIWDGNINVSCNTDWYRFFSCRNTWFRNKRFVRFSQEWIYFPLFFETNKWICEKFPFVDAFLANISYCKYLYQSVLQETLIRLLNYVINCIWCGVHF